MATIRGAGIERLAQLGRHLDLLDHPITIHVEFMHVGGGAIVEIPDFRVSEDGPSFDQVTIKAAHSLATAMVARGLTLPKATREWTSAGVLE